MRYVFTIMSVTVFFFSCFIVSPKTESKIRRIKITTRMPDRVVDNKGIVFMNELFINYFGQYEIYELPYHKTQEINNELIYDSLKYEFFLYNCKTKAGYMLKNMTDTFGNKIDGDSILKLRAYDGGVDTINFREIKIKSVNKLTGTHPLIYRYMFDNYFYDSAYLFYNKEINNIRFSFSRNLDSINQSKLYKIQFFIKQDSVAKSLDLNDFYINSFEISETPISNFKEMQKLFERFINKEKENHFK